MFAYVGLFTFLPYVLTTQILRFTLYDEKMNFKVEQVLGLLKVKKVVALTICMLLYSSADFLKN